MRYIVMFIMLQAAIVNADYKAEIAETQAVEGAYGAHLGELYFGLGALQFNQGDYKDAIKSLREAAHYTRISLGLNTPHQIPILEKEILSYIRLEDWESADERYSYLYLIQIINGVDNESTISYVKWQHIMTSRGIGENNYRRLMLAQELINRLEGADKYYYTLYNQYYVMSFSPESVVGGGDELPTGYMRFQMAQSRAYVVGKQAMEAAINMAETPQERALALASLADWNMWHTKTKIAREQYSEAYALDESISGPVRIPPVEVINAVPEEEGIAFTVKTNGELKDFDYPEGSMHLVRKMKMWRYRPKIEEGEVVEVRVEV